MRALVTGGGGFLGRYIVEALLARGDSVRVFSRRHYPELATLGAELRSGDLRKAADVDRACAGVDTVFHIAAIPGMWGPWKRYFETNVLGTRHILAACQHHNVARLVYTSSPSVVFAGTDHLDGDETLPYPDDYLCHYPHTKAIAEREVIAAHNTDGLATVSLRPHLIWGPRDNHLIPRLIQRARAGRLVQVGDGNNLVSMAYVENVAAAHLLAADRLACDSPVGGQVYFINEREPVNLWNWINALLERAGLPPVRRRISAATAWRLGRMCELVYGGFRLRGEPPMTRFVAAQLSQSHTYSIDKATRELGYVPEVDFEEGMRRLEPDLRAHAGT